MQLFEWDLKSAETSISDVEVKVSWFELEASWNCVSACIKATLAKSANASNLITVAVSALSLLKGL